MILYNEETRKGNLNCTDFSEQSGVVELLKSSTAIT